MSEIQIISLFEKILDKSSIITGENLKSRFYHIWKTDIHLESICLLLPKDTDQVSAILKICNDNNQEIVSIYINPTQFNNKEDLKAYPRNIDKDLEKLRGFKDIIVYNPSDNDVYDKMTSKDYDFDELGKVMEGKYRPGHFNGVATIVQKLFTMFKPNNAYFGEKDFQQLLIIKALVKKLKLRIKIIGCETIRDKFGLALSSRNNLMSKEEKGDAREINKLLFKAKKMYISYSVEEIREKVKEKLNSLNCCKLEYFEIDDLGRYSKFLVEDGKRIFIACWIGKTRLIDNIPI